MKQIAIVTNIPAPYRVDLFHHIQEQYKTEYCFHIIYAANSASNRNWSIDQEKVNNSHFLQSKVLEIKSKEDIRHIHIPAGVFKMLDEIDPSAVITFEYNPVALLCLKWCKSKKRKFIHLTDGTIYSERHINLVQKVSRRIIVDNADAYIASSTKAKEKLMAWGVSEEEIFVSYLTVDTSKYTALHRELELGRLLYVGRVIKQKGLHLLLEALAKVNKEFNLRIVGDGPEEDIAALRKQAHYLGIDSRIVWCGYKEGDSLQEEYRRAELFVLPTEQDCFGLVLLEALAAKVPNITSMYADGAYDIIEDRVNGYIVDPYDTDGFAQCIERAMGNTVLQQAAAQSDVRKFSFTEVGKAYINAIEFAMEKRR